MAKITPVLLIVAAEAIEWHCLGVIFGYLSCSGLGLLKHLFIGLFPDIIYISDCGVGLPGYDISWNGGCGNRFGGTNWRWG